MSESRPSGKGTARNNRKALAALCAALATLAAFCLPADIALAHSGHEHEPGFDGRQPGQPDFEQIGKTTYRYRPAIDEYEIKRQGEPPSFAHYDVAAVEEGLKAGPNTPLPSQEDAPICRTSGHRIKVVHTHRSSEPGLDATLTNELRSIVRRMNWKIAQQSSLSSGGSRAVQMVLDCNGSGEINVYDVTVAGWQYADIYSALTEGLGNPLGEGAVKYLTFDHKFQGGGVGGRKKDASKGQGNQNAIFTDVAIAYREVWTTHVPVHELFHTFGASQGDTTPAPPYSSDGGHCVDGLDILCYETSEKSEWGIFTETRCPAGEGYDQPEKTPIDCKYDTYFNAAPPPGSWLAERWDSGGQENPFLIVQGPPKASTDTPTPVKDKTATLRGTVNPEGYDTSYRFEYGLTKSYGTKVPVPDEAVGFGTWPLSVNKELSGLSPNTEYHYRVVAGNSAGTTYGEDRAFETKGPPAASASSTTVLSTLKATLKGAINPHQAATTYRFEYGSSESYGSSTADKSAGSGNSSVSVEETITGLNPGTTYHWRVRAENGYGTTYSKDESFRTPGKAVVSTEAATEVNRTHATLNASVNPEGFPTSYQFEYGPTAAYGSSIPASLKYVGSGQEAVAVGQALAGLEVEATYHFRVKAVSVEGTVYGEDRELKTWTAPSFTLAFGSKGSGNGQFNTPRGVAIDPEGNVRVVDSANNRIEKFNSKGEYLSQFGSEGNGNGQFKSPNGIAIDSAGNTWVADTLNNRIQKFNSKGEFLCKVGSEGTGNGQFKAPNGIAVDSSGNAWVADTSNNRVQKLNSACEYQSQFGTAGSGNGQFNLPGALAIDSEGNIRVADTFNNRVQKFNSKGEYLTQFGSVGSGNGQFGLPAGIAVDSSGNAWIADSANNRIQKFNSKGEYLSQFGTAGSGNGQFNLPWGIAIDSSGNAWVADLNNNRVQKWFVSPGLPTAATNSASSVSAGGATLNGTVNPSGLATTYRFEYGPTTAYGTSIPVPAESIGSGTANVAVAKAIGGLQTATTYHFRVLAANAEGETLGTDKTFTTSALAPKATTEAASPVGSTSATLHATVNPGGASTTYQFEYGTTVSYGSKVPASAKEIGSGTSDVFAGEAISGLTSGTTYHYRVKAVNSKGTTFGADREFKATAPAPSFTLAFGTKGSGNGQFNTPRGVAIDPEGNVRVVDSANNRIEKFNSKGEYLSQFGSEGNGNGQFKSPNGIAIDSSGNIWVADTLNNRIQKLNSKGEFLCKVGSEGTGNGQFKAPNGVAVDSSGNAWVADTSNNRIQKLNSACEYQSQFGSAGSGNGQFNLPGALAIDSSGNIQVADTFNNRIQKFNSKGEYLSQFGSVGSGNGQLGLPGSLAIDSAGNTWVADSGNNRIQKFNSKGEYLSQFGSEGSGNGQFNLPWGIAIDSSGNAWVADLNNNRVQKWLSPGLPTASTGSTSSVGTSGATLNATVNPTGLATVYRFEYGPTTAYGTSIPVPAESIGSGTANVAVAKAIGGLKPNTTYHFRVVASNPEGETTGADKSFATLPLAPSAATEAASPVGASSATLHATVNPGGASTTYQFEYGTTASYGSYAPLSPKNIGSGTADVSVAEAIEGLKAGTVYHFRVRAVNNGGLTLGQDEVFLTAPVAPSATTEAASSVGGSGATLNAKINPNGPDTHYQFEYGTTTAYGTSVPVAARDIGSGTEDVAVGEAIEGLSPGATYHFRVVATSAQGTTLGQDMQFTTPKPPKAVTQAASGVTATEAALNGTANANGINTFCLFEYGTTVSYGSTKYYEGLVSGSSDVAINVTLTGLAKNTAYHYRAVCGNAGGTTNGEDMSFTTKP